MTAALRSLDMHSLMAVVESQAGSEQNIPIPKLNDPFAIGALNLAMKVADQYGLQFAMANDLEADRFVVVRKISQAGKSPQ